MELLALFFQTWGTLFVVMILIGVFGLTAEPFLTLANAQNIMRQIAINAIIAIGMTMVILIGGIDLSVGSVVLFSAAVMNSLIFNRVLPEAPAIVVGVLVAALVGLFNGILIEKVRISPVITTLGTMVAIRGLGQMILWINSSWLWVRSPTFQYVKTTTWGIFPVSAVIMLVLYGLAFILINHTQFGRHIYVIGGNELAAKLCGVPVVRTKILVYTLCSTIAGIGGFLMSTRLSAISPNVGNGLEFQVITAVILGGTRLSGGIGRIEKTLLGAIIVGIVLNYMTIRGISAEYQAAATGFIILLAAVLDRLSQGHNQ
jgi:ribose transport system permease protein